MNKYEKCYSCQKFECQNLFDWVNFNIWVLQIYYNYDEQNWDSQSVVNLRVYNENNNDNKIWELYGLTEYNKEYNGTVCVDPTQKLMVCWSTESLQFLRLVKLFHFGLRIKHARCITMHVVLKKHFFKISYLFWIICFRITRKSYRNVSLLLIIMKITIQTLLYNLSLKGTHPYSQTDGYKS